MNYRQKKKQLFKKLEVLDTKKGDFLLMKYPFGQVSQFELYHFYQAISSRVKCEVICLADDTKLSMATVEELQEMRDSISSMIKERVDNVTESFVEKGEKIL